MKYIVLFLGAIVIGFFSMNLGGIKEQLQEVHTPDRQKPFVFSLETAPAQSLRGTITDFSGGVTWESRAATVSASLVSPVSLQQGERVETDTKGTIKITFGDVCSFTVLPETKIELAQTLPTHMVFIQSLGTVKYKTGKSSDVTVRSLHMIAQLSEDAEVNVSINIEKVSFEVAKGSVTIAYNNTDNVSTMRTLGVGSFTYDDETRSLQME